MNQRISYLFRYFDSYIVQNVCCILNYLLAHLTENAAANVPRPPNAFA